MREAPWFAPRGFPTCARRLQNANDYEQAEPFSVENMDAQAQPVENSTFLWITASAVLRWPVERRMLQTRRFTGGRATRSSQRIGYDARLVRSPLSGSSTKYDAVMAELIGEDVRRSDSRADRRRGAHVPRRRRV